MGQEFELPEHREPHAWAPAEGEICNIIRLENLTNDSRDGISCEWEADGWLHVHGTQESGAAWGVTSQKTPIHLEVGEYVISAEVEGGGLGKYNYVAVWSTDDSRRIGVIDNGASYRALSVTKAVDIYLWVGATGTGKTVDYRMRFMLVEGTEPAAWAPAEGETLSGGGALMSANLLDDATVTRGTKDGDGYWVLSQNDGTDKKDSPMWRIDGQPTLTENQTLHVACSVMPDEDWGSNAAYMSVEYANAAGHHNWVGSTIGNAKAGVWTRLEAEIVVPSGMRVDWGLLSNAYSWSSGAKVTGVTISYGSPVCLASSAHTPYATQDHVAAEYATKAALKVTSDAVTAEVEERGKLAGRVGTLESTAGTHASRLEQLASSIRSLVKGESTYTDPDGKSATSGIYSLVTQTLDSVTALFGSYTKTADLASTQAVKDAKKAGTDAQAAASAAQSTADSARSTAQAAASDAATAKTNAASAVSTANGASTSAANAVKTANAASSTASSASSTANSAVSTANSAKTSAASAVSTANAASSTAGAAKSTADSLATMIREDATGITVGKSADGKTWSTGRTHMDEDSFDILDKAGTVITQMAKDGASFLAGLVKLQVHEVNSNSVASLFSDFFRIDSTWQASIGAGKETSGGHVNGYAAAITESRGGRGSARLYSTQGNGSYITANNAFTVLPDSYDLSKPEYLAAALLGTGGDGSGVTHSQDAVAMAHDLDTCGPGVFSYNESTANRPTSYGTCVCIRAGAGTDTGSWLFQVALPTVGDPYWRRNINGSGWTSWRVIKSQ